MLAWNDAIMVFFHFFHFFAIFFGIFYYASSGNETEWQFLFSLFLGLFQPILDSNEATMVFFDFLILFLFFWNFLLPVGLRTERKDNFYFFSFSAFSNLFWLEMKPWWNFLLYWIFLLFFLIFTYPSGRNEMKRNDNFYFLSLSLFQPVLAWNDAIMDFYYSSSGNETERQFLFSPFVSLFQPIFTWNEATMAFFEFLIFFLFFRNFLLPVG